MDWENDKPILLLKHRSLFSEPIKLLYQESGSSKEVLWKDLQLAVGEEKKVLLHEEYKNWEALYIQINGPKKTVPIKNLEELLDNAKRQYDTEKSTSSPQPSPNSPESPEKSSNLPGQGLRLTDQKIREEIPISGEQQVLPKFTRQESDEQQNRQLEDLQAQIARLEKLVADLETEIVSLKEQNEVLAKEIKLRGAS